MRQQSLQRRRISHYLIVIGLAVLVAGGVVPSASGQNPASVLGPSASAQNARLVFTQRDTVQAFDLVSGKGYQIGTVTGRVNGTSFVDFQFAPSGPPEGDALPITFHNTVIITDIDGDQLRFDNDGTGTFHLGVPGFPFQGSGGPLQGTYVLTSATGKFADLQVGTTFGYRAVATNPPSPPGGLGTVYVQVSFK